MSLLSTHLSVPVQREEEKEEEFPFNMSDFVTVDEVGDVTDLPCSPSPTVAADPTQEDTSSSIPNNASKVHGVIHQLNISLCSY